MLTLSVIIPNYNHATFLPECLKAILSQSLQPYEILVVDDASTDNSIEIVASYQKKHPHLHLLKLKNNSGGPIMPVKEGLKKVQGDYVALCASDDIVQPNFFYDSMLFASKHPEIALCFGRFVEFENEKPYKFVEKNLTLLSSSKLMYPDEWVKITKKYHLDIPSQATIYKKELLVQLGGYDPSLKAYSDWYLNYAISFQHPIGYVPNVWGASRIIKNSYGRYITPTSRIHLCGEMIKKINLEPKEIRSRWKKSGILSRAGRGTFDYLVRNPKFVSFLPSLLFRYLRFKIASVIHQDYKKN